MPILQIGQYKQSEQRKRIFFKDIHYILIAALVDIALSTCVEPTVTGSQK